MMQEIIIAMLYMYPGALVDVLRRFFCKRTFRDEGESEVERVAKYFVYSTIITVFSLFIYAWWREKSIANVQDVLGNFLATMEVVYYLGISLILTGVFTLFLEKLQDVRSKWKTYQLMKQEGVRHSRSVDAWHELVYGKEAESIRENAILRITNGENTQAGFVKFWPEQLSDGVTLVQTELVKDYFAFDADQKNAEDMYIGRPWYCLYDAVSGTFVEVFNGDELKKYLKV